MPLFEVENINNEKKNFSVLNKSKDWKGNFKSTFVQLGATGHSEVEREKNDFYATDPKAIELFLQQLEKDDLKLHKTVWECACGQGHLSRVLEKYNYIVRSTDLIYRGYGEGGIDFLLCKEKWQGDIITNPPFKYAENFVYKGLQLLETGFYLILFLKIQFLEGKTRYELFKKFPPKYVYVNSSRQTCYINGDMSVKLSGASCYCWYIWEKDCKQETIIRWIK